LKLVSINIVNWNGLKFLSKCIDSIKLQTYKNIEINIIDNNSSDRSADFLTENYPEIRLVVNALNTGFSKAHNQAIGVSSGDYIIPLNFDIILESTFVEEMVKAIESSPNIGIVSGKLYVLSDFMQTNIIDSTGVTMKWMYPADRGQTEIDTGQFSKKEFVFGASGAAPMFRRDMLEDIKLNNEYFDEDFSIYVEDVDLCWRAQLYGWKALYTPSAVASHFRGATRDASSDRKKEYLLIGYRNRYLAIIKNAIFLHLLKNIVWIVILETRFFVSHIVKGNYFILRVPLMVSGKIRAIFPKRIIIQKRTRVSADYMASFFFYDIKQTIKNEFKKYFPKGV